MSEADLPLDGDLWRFALSIYTKPGVSDACLALQDGLDIDVNVLFFALWAGAERGIRLSAGDLAAAGDVVGPWHLEVVRGLRAIRRQMKDADYLAWSPEANALRERIKKTEIKAERIELARLQHWVDERPSGAEEAGIGPALANLATVIDRAGGEGDDRWNEPRSRIEIALRDLLG